MRFIPNPNKYLKPLININPFNHRVNYDDIIDNKTLKNKFSKYFNQSLIFTKNGQEAIEIAFMEIINKFQINNFNVLIITTSRSNYVSSCVTNSIEKFGKWTMNKKKVYNCIVVIHEFGSICELPKHLNFNIPIIEDFAPSFFLHGKTNINSIFKIFSLPKFFTTQEGGIILGENLPQKRNHNFSSFTRNVINYEFEKINEIINRRKKNESILIKSLTEFGFKKYYRNFQKMIPWVLMFRNNGVINNLQNFREYLENNGIVNGVFYGNDAFYLPVHQNLDIYEIEFIVFSIKNFIENEN